MSDNFQWAPPTLTQLNQIIAENVRVSDVMLRKVLSIGGTAELTPTGPSYVQDIPGVAYTDALPSITLLAGSAPICRDSVAYCMDPQASRDSLLAGSPASLDGQPMRLTNVIDDSTVEVGVRRSRYPDDSFYNRWSFHRTHFASYLLPEPRYAATQAYGGVFQRLRMFLAKRLGYDMSPDNAVVTLTVGRDGLTKFYTPTLGDTLYDSFRLDRLTGGYSNYRHGGDQVLNQVYANFQANFRVIGLDTLGLDEDGSFVGDTSLLADPLVYGFINYVKQHYFRNMLQSNADAARRNMEKSNAFKLLTEKKHSMLRDLGMEITARRATDRAIGILSQGADEVSTIPEVVKAYLSYNRHSVDPTTTILGSSEAKLKDILTKFKNEVYAPNVAVA